MTQMPQMVALFNGVGGERRRSSRWSSLHEMGPHAEEVGWFTLAATAFTILVGSVSFSGSAVTFARAPGA